MQGDVMALTINCFECRKDYDITYDNTYVKTSEAKPEEYEIYTICPFCKEKQSAIAISEARFNKLRVPTKPAGFQ
jgi:hypothetical protein